MAEIPRDPRQLARDILAGKVRIEDLQRERQMRAPGGAVPTARVPVQPARPVPARPMQPARPVQQRPMAQPPRLVQRSASPAQQPRRMPAAPLARPPGGGGGAPRAIAMPARQQFTVAPPVPARPVAPVAPPLPQTVPVVSTTVRRGLRLPELARSVHALRQGILLAEVLGKPVALREEW